MGSEGRRSRETERHKIDPIADENVGHSRPFLLAPTNSASAPSLSARKMMLHAAASGARPSTCCRGVARTKRRLVTQLICSFIPGVPPMALQVAAVLSGPRAVAGHRHLELFVLMSSFVRSDDHHEDRKGSKSHRSPTIVGSTSRHFGRHPQILTLRCPRRTGAWWCTKLSQVRVYRRAAAAMHG